MTEKYKDDWRCHRTVSGDAKMATAWGLWVTSPHTRLHLSDMYPSRSEAMSAAREAIGKGWADRAVVRRLGLGPCVVLEE